jgi:hypothetical protein
MVFQMIIQINDALVFEIRFAVVGSAVYHVCNTCLLESFLVFGHIVTSQVEEVLNYLGHHTVPN